MANRIPSEVIEQLLGVQLIPIKGYAGFDPLKHCWIGAMFDDQQLLNTPAVANNKDVLEPLMRIAQETREDYSALRGILESHGVTVHQSKPHDATLDITKWKPPITPRDDFAVIGESIYMNSRGLNRWRDVLCQINQQSMHIRTMPPGVTPCTSTIVRLGKDLYWDIDVNRWLDQDLEYYTNRWSDEGYRIHKSHRGYHSDSAFHVVKPGVIVSMEDVQDYDDLFPGWDVLYIGDEPSYSHQDEALVKKFNNLKLANEGRWWLMGEEHNAVFTEFVNTSCQGWTGYMEETVFDVNMMNIDHNTVIVNNYNKRIFDFLESHGVTPIQFEFRHRYFFDGAVNCVTQDLYREGELLSYL